MCILSVETPPSFFASQVYRPSSFFLILVRSKDILFPLSVLFLNQDISGLGKPALILQVKLTLYPSLVTLLVLGMYTTGRTKREEKWTNKNITWTLTQHEDCTYSKLQCNWNKRQKGLITLLLYKFHHPSRLQLNNFSPKQCWSTYLQGLALFMENIE